MDSSRLGKALPLEYGWLCFCAFALLRKGLEPGVCQCFHSIGSGFEVTGLIRVELGPLGWEAFFGFVVTLFPHLGSVLCSQALAKTTFRITTLPIPAPFLSTRGCSHGHTLTGHNPYSQHHRTHAQFLFLPSAVTSAGCPHQGRHTEALSVSLAVQVIVTYCLTLLSF